MRILGIQKLSTLDFPDQLACVIFTGGCNFRCPYCHNPELVLPAPDAPTLDPEKVLAFLRERQGKLDGVAITGGEPTLHADLPELIQKIRDLGFKVKLDTNGTNPAMLAELLQKKMLDYVAMDLKYPIRRYAELTHYPDITPIQKSLKLLLDSKIDYEFRSTITPRLHSEKEIEAMGQDIRGAKNWYLQNFRPGKTLDPSFSQERAFTNAELQTLQQIGAKYVTNCVIRDWKD